MIAWLILFGLLLILLTLPARIFGALCGRAAGVLVRDRKSPPRSPIEPNTQKGMPSMRSDQSLALPTLPLFEARPLIATGISKSRWQTFYE